MFEFFLLGRKYGLSDEKLEGLAVDSLRVMRFLRVTKGDATSDRSPIPHYRSQLDENTMREFRDTTKARLDDRGYVATGGQMPDYSFTLVLFNGMRTRKTSRSSMVRRLLSEKRTS